jgi:hypothetical protein
MCGTGKQPISHPVPRGVTDACIWRPEILCVERYRMGYVRNWNRGKYEDYIIYAAGAEYDTDDVLRTADKRR